MDRYQSRSFGAGGSYPNPVPLIISCPVDDFRYSPNYDVLVYFSGRLRRSSPSTFEH
ncbi:hypothetical protein BDV23DRAFT_165493 [Aspergillus alliaceus]|uniref:Uncharacterized protein n=1 Tax=Petromyces alliaceus TaxID=209559 RepID=A0A5N7BU07_PETAA|nr:hypothetical protein BDV23DRAFT_165493 [Aspergillus alliaceus]